MGFYCDLIGILLFSHKVHKIFPSDIPHVLHKMQCYWFLRWLKVNEFLDELNLAHKVRLCTMFTYNAELLLSGWMFLLTNPALNFS